MIRLEKLSRNAALASLLCLAIACGSSGKKKEPIKKNGGDKTAGENKNGSDSNLDLDTKYDAALDFEEKGNFREAYKLFCEVQTEDPNYRQLSQILDGDTYGELVTIQKDIEDLNDDPPQLRSTYHVDFAKALQKRGPRYRDQAKLQFDKALELFPDSFDAHFGLADLYMESGYAGKAITHFTRAGEIKSNKGSRTSLAHYNLAFLYRATPVEEGGDSKKSLENARLAVSYAPEGDLNTRRFLAEVLNQEGLKEEAMKEAEKIVALEGSDESDKSRLERFKSGEAGTSEIWIRWRRLKRRRRTPKP
ncbi:MAG: hypothetical protein P1V97_28065, partial [Planctomycetota bacterium]|nr:hypothetical protein [Planctomycetota bacterium]